MATFKWVKSILRNFWFCCLSRNLLSEQLMAPLLANLNRKRISSDTKGVVLYLRTLTRSTATVWGWMRLSWFVRAEVVICPVSQIWQIRTPRIGRRPAALYPQWWVLNVDMVRTNPLFLRLSWNLTVACLKPTKQSVKSGPFLIATLAQDPFSSEVLVATLLISWSNLQIQKN